MEGVGEGTEPLHGKKEAWNRVGGGGEGGWLVEAAYLASFAGTPKATHDDSRTWVAEAFWELRARVFKI